MVVKVKDAETKRNKASVARTGWNKHKNTSTTTPKKDFFFFFFFFWAGKKDRLYSSRLQLLFNRKWANEKAIVQQENEIHRVTGLDA